MTADAQKVETQALAVVDEAKALAVTTDDEYELAATFLKERCKAVQKEINATFDPIIKKQHAAHKEAVAQKNRIAGPIKEAERVVKFAMSTYWQQKEKERLALEAEARKRAREEAEREALERAVQLEDEGRQEEAEAVIAEPVRPAPVIVDNAPPKVKGVGVRRTWRYRVLDTKLVKQAYLVLDDKKIGQVVRALGKQAEEAVGGIEVYEESTIAARG